MIIVGTQAPDFTAEAVVDGEIADITLSRLAGRYVLLFFYPLDFSFVCPSELHSLQRALTEFQRRDVEVLGISVDSVFTHRAFLQAPKSTGGISGITFSLVSDISHRISRSFGVLAERESVALRATFVLDKEGIVQYGSVNTLDFGRSIGELLRVVDGIQFAETHGGLCPTNWQPGDALL